ncbi:hypothetical protein BST63_35420 [Bradyrhizobium canariense]|uniref:Uncharacterized protein n=1 Tax=Bradyrhizobium canariense TaxID=255045 RepID=A0ABX3WSS6_9BRAD|nr:hypothetical protein BSR47_31980 [Bradyrhizobium canariense]OSJ21026.1 hypothetical protein BST63_35420 [Bradyrhizobium canariense]
MFLLHGLDKPLVVENGQQVVNRLVAVPWARLDIASQDGLGFLYRSGYAILMPVLHSLMENTPSGTPRSFAKLLE